MDNFFFLSLTYLSSFAKSNFSKRTWSDVLVFCVDDVDRNREGGDQIEDVESLADGPGYPAPEDQLFKPQRADHGHVWVWSEKEDILFNDIEPSRF